MTFSVLILGSSSAKPTLTRHPTAQVVNIREQIMLVDCGEGTQVQLRKYKVNFQRINHVFISHLHGDHYFGLVGLLSTLHLIGRRKELHIYAQSDLEKIIRIQLELSGSDLLYPIHFHPLRFDKPERIVENSAFMVYSVPLDHRVPTCGFVFREKQKDRKIKKSFLLQEQIPFNQIPGIKKGKDYISAKGKLFRNSEITRNPPFPRSYAYISDTRYTEDILPYIRDVSLLYHESTFMHDKASDAQKKYHSTTLDAANIATKANAKQLLLG
ncbi:MAG: ribonuclease Z, partial [Bacteroidales bacterium]|nr:ribonuclease Z [Bacteroidales bacterium]